MSKYTEMLNIDSENLQKTAKVFEAFAKIIESEGKGPSKNSQHLVPGYYMQAASLLVLTDVRGSVKLFRSAAKAYRKMNNPSWKIAAICGGAVPSRSEEENEREIPEFQRTPNIEFYDLLWEYRNWQQERIIGGYRLEGFSSEMNIRYNDLPVSRVGVEMSEYLKLMQSSSLEDLQGSAGPIGGFQYILDRARRQLDAKRADTYHWRQLRGILPVEPELLAFFVLLVKQHPQLHMSQPFGNFSELTLLPWRIAEEINRG